MRDEQEKKRIPLRQAIIYASGYFGVTLISFSVGIVPQVLYVPNEGGALISTLQIGGLVILGGIAFGLLNGFGRIIDGLVDPWIGNMSDYWKSRLGRRKPFIIIGTPLMGLFLVLFTLPLTPEPSMLNFFWLAIIYPLFFLFYTAAITPYLAMFPEITNTAKDRLLITTLLSFFLIFGSVVGVVLVGLMPSVLSYTHGSIIIACLSAIPMFLVVAFVSNPAEPRIDEIPERPPVINQVKDALGYKPFRIYLFAMIAFWFAFEMIKNSAKYFAAKLFGSEDKFIILLGLALGVAAVGAIGAYWMGRTIGKRKSMIIMGIAFIILLPFLALIGKGPLEPRIAGYAIFALMGFPIAILLVVPKTLLADIIDSNNEKYGKKREALFFASQALLNKIGIAFSKLIMNLLLPIGASASTIGYHDNAMKFLLPMGAAVESPAVTETGVRLIGPIGAIFVLAGLLIFLRMPDIEKR